MDQRNLLLAIVLSVGILIGFQFLIEHFHLTKTSPAPPPETSAQTAASGAARGNRRRVAPELRPFPARRHPPPS